MLLLWFLIIANIIGGFVAASSIIVSKIPELAKVANTLNRSKNPIGNAVLLVSIINIFNFWGPHYPRLTLIAGLLTGFVLSVDLLKKFEMTEGTRNKIISFAQKIQVPAGIFSIVIGLIWVLKVFFDVLEFVL